MTTARVPRCPDCGEPGVLVRKEHFRCPECHSVWEQVGWRDIITDELDALARTDRTRNIRSLICVVECKCDRCGEEIKIPEKYCYNSNIKYNRVDESSGESGARYCVKCSLKLGYLKMVKNKSGETYPVMFLLKDEEVLK